MEFRFRAQAALELRRKQENDAAAALARAEGARQAAETQREEAERNRRAAQARRVATERGGSDSTTLTWHQNWIARLADEVSTAAAAVEARTADVRAAETAWRQARQRRLALERLRERAWRKHQQELLRQELKVIDELARLRFVLPDPLIGDR